MASATSAPKSAPSRRSPAKSLLRRLQRERSHALRVGNGSSVWTRHIGGLIESPPAVAGGRLYLGDLNDTWRPGRRHRPPHLDALDLRPGEARPRARRRAALLRRLRRRHALRAGLRWACALESSNRRPFVGVPVRGRSSRPRPWPTGASTSATPTTRFTRSGLDGQWPGATRCRTGPTGRLRVSGGRVFVTSWDGTIAASPHAPGRCLAAAAASHNTISSPTVIGPYVYVADRGRAGTAARTRSGWVTAARSGTSPTPLLDGDRRRRPPLPLRRLPGRPPARDSRYAPGRRWACP